MNRPGVGAVWPCSRITHWIAIVTTMTAAPTVRLMFTPSKPQPTERSKILDLIRKFTNCDHQSPPKVRNAATNCPCWQDQTPTESLADWSTDDCKSVSQRLSRAPYIHELSRIAMLSSGNLDSPPSGSCRWNRSAETRRARGARGFRCNSYRNRTD